MKILALETTERTGSIAAAQDAEVLAEIDLPEDLRSAQSLAPGIRDLLEGVGWRPADVRLVAVTVGPGSFTGLRIGVATAKTFAYATGAEVLGVDTHEVLALGCPADVAALSVVVDAQRGQVVARSFHRGDTGTLVPDSEGALIDLDTWLAGLVPRMHVTGPILQRMIERLPESVQALPSQVWRPTARNVARLAYQQYLAGRRDDLWRLAPVYSRLSAAEEKRKVRPDGAA